MGRSDDECFPSSGWVVKLVSYLSLLSLIYIYIYSLLFLVCVCDAKEYSVEHSYLYIIILHTCGCDVYDNFIPRGDMNGGLSTEWYTRSTVLLL